MKRSRLSQFADCKFGIGNRNGHVVCEHSPDAPRGPYLDSCTGCVVLSDVLECVSCTAQSGAEVRAATFDLQSDRCDGSAVVLDNRDGKLECGAAAEGQQNTPHVPVTPQPPHSPPSSCGGGPAPLSSTSPSPSPSKPPAFESVSDRTEL
eukprot:gnl/Spiro4/17544_TR9347_c0_g1_i1.p2 gnl/Spiro4/17544_TR9347_c0_g1~~gnl/Spiro4/17544_TR9347_c0_g1_i1.p2  ORF type:complete len:150 (+),score=11.88 gnl/Spiro4/17544_TR9347_c0_g1_i1:299-748(+)